MRIAIPAVLAAALLVGPAQNTPAGESLANREVTFRRHPDAGINFASKASSALRKNSQDPIFEV
jgi:hypothetical protein